MPCSNLSRGTTIRISARSGIQVTSVKDDLITTHIPHDATVLFCRKEGIFGRGVFLVLWHKGEEWHYRVSKKYTSRADWKSVKKLTILLWEDYSIKNIDTPS